MSTLVKNQHYVWQHYLKPWTSKGKLFCLRQKENKLFGSSTKGIASETFFYRVERLTEEDMFYLNRTIDLAKSPEIRDIHQNTIKLFQMPFILRDRFTEMAGGRPLGRKLLAELDKAEKNAGEQYHTMTEHQGAWILERLQNEDCSFFEDKHSALEFVHYLSHQFFRTPKFKDLVSRLPNPYLNLDLKRTWFFESHFFADNIGSSMYVARENYRFLFLRNSTSIPFITSDQPVINLNNHTHKTLKMLYPLTPRLAVVFFEDADSEFRSVKDLTTGDVEYYNQAMFERSFDQIYSNNKEYLQTFRLRDKLY